MKIPITLSLTSNDLDHPHKDCRAYTDDGQSLGFGSKLIAQSPSSTVLILEVDAKAILQYIKKRRDNNE